MHCCIRGIYLATTYSHKTYRLTTIGAEAFHFRVRNGTGWFHFALVTRGRLFSKRAVALVALLSFDSSDQSNRTDQSDQKIFVRSLTSTGRLIIESL